MANRAKQILDDIVTLEVNTIINRNISAQKMPRPRFAMHKIASGYKRYLNALELELDLALPEKIFSHRITFESLANYAEKAIANIDLKRSTYLKNQDGTHQHSQLDTILLDYDHEIVLLNRIKNSCDEIIRLVEEVSGNRREDFLIDKNLEFTAIKELKKLEPIPFQPEQLLRLRKIFEIGVETVAMQTCVQLDGDVVTRINPRYALSGPLTQEIQKIHAEGLEISIGRWRDIVSTIGSIFKAISGFK